MLHNIIAFMHPPRTPWQLPNMVRTCVFLSSRARGYRPRKCRCNPKWDDTGKNVGTHTYTYISYAFDFLWFLNKGLDHTSICSIKNTFGPFINTYIKRTISCMCVRMIWMHMLRSYHWRHSAGPLRQASGCRGAQDGAKLVCWIRPANLNSRYRGLTMINPWFIFTGVPVLKGFLSLIVWGCSGGSP